MLSFLCACRRKVVFLVALLAACGPRYATPPKLDWALVNRTPVLFIRVVGGGEMAPPPAPVEYELCYDFAQNKVVEVHDAASGRDVDAGVAELFRSWKWSVLSTVRMTGGVRCWRERIEPVIGVDGSITVRASAGEPVGLMHLDDLSVTPAHGRAEDEEHVAFVDRFEDHGVAYVMLAPRIGVAVPGAKTTPHASAPPSAREKRSGEMPHLSPEGRLRFRGNKMQAMFMVCAGTDGRVASIVPLLPIDGETIHIEQTVKRWLYPAWHIPVCRLIQFEFLE